VTNPTGGPSWQRRSLPVLSCKHELAGEALPVLTRAATCLLEKADPKAAFTVDLSHWREMSSGFAMGLTAMCSGPGGHVAVALS